MKNAIMYYDSLAIMYTVQGQAAKSSPPKIDSSI